MSKIEISKQQYGVFGNCVKITNGIVELFVTVDFGPRVIHFSRVGMENIFYQDEAKGTLGDAFPLYEGEQCTLYGGHRLWISPEVMPRCYHPDNLPVEYKEVESGVEFKAQVEKFNGIQKIMTITLLEDKPVVNVEHKILNCGTWEIELAPWCLTMMAAGGKEVVPQPNTETGLLANRTIVLWPYSEMNDSRVYFGKDYITLTQDSTKENAFKFGINNDHGWGAYFNKNQLFVKHFEPQPDGMYPDNGCSYETFTNAVMLEAETLGELVILEPNNSVVQYEDWHLYEEHEVPSNDETEIKRILDKYI